MDYFNQHSERLTFRKCSLEDIPVWSEFFHDRSRLPWLGLDPEKDPALAAEDWIRRQLERYEVCGTGHLAATLKVDGRLIGMGGVIPRTLDGKATSFLGWDVLDKELMEEDPKMIAVIRDSNGELVRKMKVPDSEGFHRVTWNLRRPSPSRVLLDEKPIGAPEDEPTAMMVAPGRYSVQLVRMDGGQAQVLGEPKEFNLIKLRDGALPAAEPEVVAGFWKELEDFQRNLSAISYELRRAENRVRAMQIALKRSPAEIGQLDEQLHDCLMDLKELDARIYGSPKKREVRENTRPTLGDRFGFARTGVSNSTYGPTAAHRESFDLAKKEMDEIQRDAMDILGTRITAIEKALIANGAPWVEGQGGGFGE